MTNLVQESDSVDLSHEEIVEMYLAIIKATADQKLNRDRKRNLVNVSPDLLKQLMNSQMKTKKCECCGCCGRSPGVMAIATHGTDLQKLRLLNPIAR